MDETKSRGAKVRKPHGFHGPPIKLKLGGIVEDIQDYLPSKGRSASLKIEVVASISVNTKLDDETLTELR